MTPNKQLLFNSAVQYLDYKEVEALIEDPNVDINEGESTAWKFIILNGDFDLFKLFLDKGNIDPTIQDNYALYNSVKFSHIKILKYLLNIDNIDPSIDDFCIIHKALEYKNKENINILLSHPKIKPHLIKAKPELYKELMSENIQYKMGNF